MLSILKGAARLDGPLKDCLWWPKQGQVCSCILLGSEQLTEQLKGGSEHS